LLDEKEDPGFFEDKNLEDDGKIKKRNGNKQI
jgi:hypothetical protein